MIIDNKVYFRNDFNGYWRIDKLPLGESIGIDNHPSLVIEKLQIIESYINQQIEKKKDKNK
ncbi:hypothetical protein [Orenia marismortui]|nr:hypothetical protein [Orenia marismortui]